MLFSLTRTTVHVVELPFPKRQSLNEKALSTNHQQNKLYMNISTYHVHTCIKVTSILTILYMLIYIISLI